MHKEVLAKGFLWAHAGMLARYTLAMLERLVRTLENTQFTAAGFVGAFLSIVAIFIILKYGNMSSSVTTSFLALSGRYVTNKKEGGTS